MNTHNIRSRSRHRLQVERLEARAMLSNGGIGFEADVLHQPHRNDNRLDEYRFSLSHQQRDQLIQDFLHEQARLKELDYSYPVWDRASLSKDAWIEPISPETSLVFKVSPEPEFSIVVLGIMNNESSRQPDHGDQVPISISSPGSDALAATSPAPNNSAADPVETEPGEATNQPAVSETPTEIIAAVEATDDSSSASVELGTETDIAVIDEVFAAHGVEQQPSSRHELLRASAVLSAVELHNAGEPTIELAMSLTGEHVQSPLIPNSDALASDTSTIETQWGYDEYYLRGETGLKGWLFDYSLHQDSLLKVAIEDMAHIRVMGDDASSVMPLMSDFGTNQRLVRSDQFDADTDQSDTDWGLAASITSNPALSSAAGIIVMVTGMNMIQRESRGRNDRCREHERFNRERRDP